MFLFWTPFSLAQRVSVCSCCKCICLCMDVWLEVDSSIMDVPFACLGNQFCFFLVSSRGMRGRSFEDVPLLVLDVISYVVVHGYLVRS